MREILMHFTMSFCTICSLNLITANDKNRQLMELFILSSSQEYSKKLFHPWEVLESYITCMYLYGNTFILGVDVGDVSLYYKCLRCVASLVFFRFIFTTSIPGRLSI